MKRIFLLVCVLVGCMTVKAQSSLNKGKSYYEMAEENRDADYYRIALTNLQAAAKEGYGEACFLLGQMYRYGKGTEQNYPIAARMYQRAIEFGYQHGKAQLGQMYELGYGVPKDQAKALKLYRESVEEGDLWGKTLLGDCYHYGLLGCEQDYEKSFALYSEAAEKYYYAMQMVGACYEAGRGVAQDYKQAFDYYTNSRQPEALFLAALIKHDKIRPKYKYHESYAYQTMLDAIKAGCRKPEAYYYAALWQDDYRKYVTHASTQYMDYNPEFSSTAPISLLTIAAEAGFGPAQKLLGDWYREGLYTAVNLPKAKAWYAKAKANGEEVPEL